MRTMTLQLDDTDYDAIQRAIATRQSFRCWPSSDEVDSDLAGLAVAEICRCWMEMLDLGRHDSSDK